MGDGSAPVPKRPTPGQEAPPPGRPRAAPTARKASSQERARWGWGRVPTPAPTPWGARSPELGRGNRTGPPSPKASQTEQGTEAGHAEGHGPRGTALPAPSTRTARGARATPTQGGEGGDPARARAHTHKRDTRGKPDGQPDRARGTHRPNGMAYQRARMGGTQMGRPATNSAGNAGR